MRNKCQIDLFIYSYCKIGVFHPRGPEETWYCTVRGIRFQFLPQGSFCGFSHPQLPPANLVPRAFCWTRKKAKRPWERGWPRAWLCEIYMKGISRLIVTSAYCGWFPSAWSHTDPGKNLMDCIWNCEVEQHGIWWQIWGQCQWQVWFYKQGRRRGRGWGWAFPLGNSVH